VTSLLPTVVGETRQQALNALRPGLAFYAGFFSRYNRLMAEHGFAEEAAAIASPRSRGDRWRVRGGEPNWSLPSHDARGHMRLSPPKH
jgi:hypothetical protein